MAATGGERPATDGMPAEEVLLSSTEEVLKLLCGGGGPADGTSPALSHSSSAASTDPFDFDAALAAYEQPSARSVLEEAGALPRYSYFAFGKYREESDTLSPTSSCMSTPESSFNKRYRDGAVWTPTPQKSTLTQPSPLHRLGSRLHEPSSLRRLTNPRSVAIHRRGGRRLA